MVSVFDAITLALNFGMYTIAFIALIVAILTFIATKKK